MILGKVTGNELFIGDISGNFDALVRLIEKAPKGLKIVGLGDLNDRGNQTKDVFDFFMNKKNNAVAIKGNHEHLMYDFLTGGSFYGKYNWLLVGGIDSIKSFCKDSDKERIELMRIRFKELFELIKEETPPKEELAEFDLIVNEFKDIGKKNIAKKYIKWLSNLPIFYENEYIIATHAPINPRYESLSEFLIEAKDVDAVEKLLWNRSVIAVKEKIQLFGHENLEEVQFYKTGNDVWGMCLDTCSSRILTGFCSLTDEIISQSI